MAEEKDEDEASRTSCLLLSLLPESLIINNILLKLPVRSVMRLRCVCKYFWSLTTSPTFVNLHLDHAKTDQLINNHPALILISYLDHDWISPVELYWKSSVAVVMYSTTSCDLSSPSPSGEDNTVIVVEDVKIPCAYRSTWAPYTFQIWGSCNGLLCVVEAREYKGQHNCFPCIWNPCTKEFKRLPPPMELGMLSNRDGFLYKLHHGFGYDHTMNDYKVIIWIHWDSLRPGVPSESVINVYTLGTTTNSPSWRCAPYKPPFAGILGRERRAGLYFRGALHWVIRTCVVDHHHLEEAMGPYRKQIVSFDIEAEAFRELVPRPPPHPHGCSSSDHNEGDENWVLQELKGCLCLLITCNRIREKSIIDVWMMKDYGLVNGCWTNLLTIVAEPPTAAPAPSLYRCGPRWIPLRFCENGEILILEKGEGLYMYDPMKKRTRSIRETPDIRIGDGFFCTETYIESLVSLKTVFPAAAL